MDQWAPHVHTTTEKSRLPSTSQYRQGVRWQYERVATSFTLTVLPFLTVSARLCKHEFCKYVTSPEWPLELTLWKVRPVSGHLLWPLQWLPERPAITTPEEPFLTCTIIGGVKKLTDGRHCGSLIKLHVNGYEGGARRHRSVDTTLCGQWLACAHTEAHRHTRACRRIHNTLSTQTLCKVSLSVKFLYSVSVWAVFTTEVSAFWFDFHLFTHPRSDWIVQSTVLIRKWHNWHALFLCQASQIFSKN